MPPGQLSSPFGVTTLKSWKSKNMPSINKFPLHIRNKGSIDTLLTIGAFVAGLFITVVMTLIFLNAGISFSNSPYHCYIFLGWNFYIGYRAWHIIYSWRSPLIIPCLESINSFPSVAILYTTKDDAQLSAISMLKSIEYRNHDIFILDDSQTEMGRNIVDKFPFKIVRRISSEGAKAGNLNNWLNQWGRKYTYFVILDSDSNLPPSWLENMIRFAEHCDNRYVAVFQSKLCVNKGTTLLESYQHSMSRIHTDYFKRIGNRISTLQNWGHNLLVRTHSVTEIGGFDERFVSEDTALSFALLERGYVCRFVDVQSMEDIPHSLSTLTKKSIRVTFSILQILIKGHWRVPMYHAIYLLMAVLPLFLIVFTIPLLISSAWHSFFYTSFFEHLSMYALNSSEIKRLLLIWMYLFVIMTFDVPLMVRAGLSCNEILKTKLMGFAFSVHLAPKILFKCINILCGKQLEFNVTSKVSVGSPPTWTEICPTISIASLFIIPTAMRPAQLLVDIGWFLLFLTLPFVLKYSVRKEKIR